MNEIFDSFLSFHIFFHPDLENLEKQQEFETFFTQVNFIYITLAS